MRGKVAREVKRGLSKGKARETHFLNCVKSAILCNLCEMKAKVRPTNVHIYIHKGKAKAYASKTHAHQLKRGAVPVPLCFPEQFAGQICFLFLCFFLHGRGKLKFFSFTRFFLYFYFDCVAGMFFCVLMRQFREVFYFRTSVSLGIPLFGLGIRQYPFPPRICGFFLAHYTSIFTI